VAEGGECPTPCKKKEGGIVWEGEMYMGNISGGIYPGGMSGSICIMQWVIGHKEWVTGYS